MMDGQITTAPAKQAAIAIRNLTVSYNRVPAVHHLSGDFPAGSLTAVVGPNGAGKSTLLNTIAGVLKPDEGSVTLSGIARRDIAYLPQRANVDQSFPISVLDTVSLGLWRETGALGPASDDGRKRMLAALARLGLKGLGHRPIGSLSVGQFQRVLFARLLLQDAGLILLDEPFAGLDTPTTTDLMHLVGDWNAQGRTVVAVLHDLAQVKAMFPRALLLSRGCVAWGATQLVLTADNLAAAGYAPEPWVAALAGARQ